MKNTSFTKSVVFELVFVARNPTKKYPHGYGVPTTIMQLNGIDSKSYDPKEVLRIANEAFSDKEFEIINAIPVRMWSAMPETEPDKVSVPDTSHPIEVISNDNYPSESEIN